MDIKITPESVALILHDNYRKADITFLNIFLPKTNDKTPFGQLHIFNVHDSERGPCIFPVLKTHSPFLPHRYHKYLLFRP